LIIFIGTEEVEGKDEGMGLARAPSLICHFLFGLAYKLIYKEPLLPFLNIRYYASSNIYIKFSSSSWEKYIVQ
jgi:hypothetical protein